MHTNTSSRLCGPRPKLSPLPSPAPPPRPRKRRRLPPPRARSPLSKLEAPLEPRHTADERSRGEEAAASAWNESNEKKKKKRPVRWSSQRAAGIGLLFSILL